MPYTRLGMLTPAREPATRASHVGTLGRQLTWRSAVCMQDNVPYHAPGYRSVISEQLEHAGLSDDDAAVAVQKVNDEPARLRHVCVCGWVGWRRTPLEGCQLCLMQPARVKHLGQGAV